MRHEIVILRQTVPSRMLEKKAEDHVVSGPVAVVFDPESATYERIDLSQLTLAERIRFLMNERSTSRPDALKILVHMGHHHYQRITITLAEFLKKEIDLLIKQEMPIRSIALMPLYILKKMPRVDWSILVREIEEKIQIIGFASGQILFTRIVPDNVLDEEIEATKHFMGRFGCYNEDDIKVYSTFEGIPNALPFGTQVDKLYEKCATSRKGRFSCPQLKINVLAFLVPRFTRMFCGATLLGISSLFAFNLHSIGNNVEEIKGLQISIVTLNQAQTASSSMILELDLYSKIKEPSYKKTLELIEKISPLILQKTKAKAILWKDNKLHMLLEPISKTDLRILVRMLGKVIPDYTVNIKTNEQSDAAALILEATS